MSMERSVSAVYFGKIPSRGDFMRSTRQTGLTQTIDRWLTQGVEMMATDPRWKEIYDGAFPSHFAFLGANSNAVLVGHLIASNDTSGRRFPFVMAGTFEVEAGLEFMMRCPMVLAKLWSRFEQIASSAHSATDANGLSQQLDQMEISVDLARQTHEQAYQEFLESHTVSSLSDMLKSSAQDINLRRAILGLGLLLQPVPSSGLSQLERGVMLPLPEDVLYQPMIATLWMDLVAPLLSRGNFELAIFIPRSSINFAKTLNIGFAGGSPVNLHAALDSRAIDTTYVNLLNPEWVEEQAGQDYAVRKLSSYLEQPQLSLSQAVATFREAFMGV